MTMKLGQIETTGVPGRRDAFHVASVLVRSEEQIHAKDNVRFTDASYTAVKLSGPDDRHGVVDTFVKDIKIGDLFWVMLLPGSVGDLTHNFNINTDLPPIETLAPQPLFRGDYYEDDTYDTIRCREEGCSGY